MKAQKFFDETMLIDLESALFTDSTKESFIKYALINETQKVYYLGISNTIPGIASRARSAIKGPEYQLLAWGIQNKIAVSNLSSWLLVCFKDGVPDNRIHEVMREHGIEQVVKARPYDFNPMSEVRIYKAQHIRNGLNMWYSTAIADPNTAARHVKRKLRALSKEYPQTVAEKLLGIVNVTYSKEWVIIDEIVPENVNLSVIYNQVMGYCRQSINEWLSKKG